MFARPCSANYYITGFVKTHGNIISLRMLFLSLFNKLYLIKIFNLQQYAICGNQRAKWLLYHCGTSIELYVLDYWS